MGSARQPSEIVRLSRGQSDNFLRWLENHGLRPWIANSLSHTGTIEERSWRPVAMMLASLSDGFWSGQIKLALEEIGASLDNAVIGRVPGPELLSCGQIVDRIREGWALYYMPSREQFPESKIFDLCAPPNEGQSIFRPIVIGDPRPFGYWYWFRIISADDHKDSYRMGYPSTMAVKECASLEEVTVAVHTARVSGFRLSIPAASVSQRCFVRNAHGVMASPETPLFVSLEDDAGIRVAGWQVYGYPGWWVEDPSIYLCQSERIATRAEIQASVKELLKIKD